jgi:hypothetical protein
VRGDAVVSNLIQLSDVSTLEEKESCGAYIIVVEKKVAVTSDYKVSRVLKLLKHTIIKSRYSGV